MGPRDIGTTVPAILWKWRLSNTVANDDRKQRVYVRRLEADVVVGACSLYTAVNIIRDGDETVITEPAVGGGTGARARARKSRRDIKR